MAGYNWESMLNVSAPTFNAPMPEFKEVKLAGPSQDIRDLGKAFKFEGGGQDYISKESLTGTRLSNLLSSDNPYIKNAKDRALRMANARGMLSSTLATNAAESAAINAALPIAESESKLLGQADLARQEADIKSKLSEQSYLSNLGQVQQQAEYNAAAQLFNAMNDRQKTEFEAALKQYLQTQELGARGILSKEEQDAQMERLQQELQNRMAVASLQAQTQKSIAASDRASRERIANIQESGALQRAQLSANTQRGIADAQNQTNLQIKNMELDFREKQDLYGSIDDIYNNYYSTQNNIINNPNMNDDARQAWLDYNAGAAAHQINETINRYGGGGTYTSGGGGTSSGATWVNPKPY